MSTPSDNVSPSFEACIRNPLFREAVQLINRGELAGLQTHLKRHPELVEERVFFEDSNYFQNPSLLEFIAENPVREGKLPANIVEITRSILEAGAKNHPDMLEATLKLVATGRVPRECGVQIPLIDLLCDYGADPNSAMPGAHGEFEAAEALLRWGARLTLPVAAALGRSHEAACLLPAASAQERHEALALSAQFGHSEIVRSLLDSGEDPNRYNPAGMHSHSTPLHQAALAGHREVVRLLLERGARRDLRDTLWQGTARDWADHAGESALASYLGDFDAVPVDRSNPWLTVPLEEYEGHMQAPGVQQLQALSELFARVLASCHPASVGILGIAGGNGLEHIDPLTTHRVVGVDVNGSYLQAVRQRFPELTGLDLHQIDLANESLDLEPVQLVHAALLFEHAGIGRALDNALRFVAEGGYFSVILQLPSEFAEEISKTGFSSMQNLKEQFSLISQQWFRNELFRRGWKLLEEMIYPLASGKGLLLCVFARA